MSDFLRRIFGLSEDEASLVLNLLAVLVGAVVLIAPARALIRRLRRMISFSTGRADRAYRRWYLDRYGTLVDIYLGSTHKLDLSATYVSLSFDQSEVVSVAAPAAKPRSVAVPSSPATTVVDGRDIASFVLADQETRRVIVTGAPGTGKSTLLKAYGAGVLRTHRGADESDLRTIRHSDEIPFFVPLRHFARTNLSLIEYLTAEVLGKAGVSGGPEYLRRLLRSDRCTVLLDGLDEVPDPLMATVEQRVNAFANGDNAAMPTQRARLILSCRRQNFDRIEKRWVPTFAPRAYTLSPLRDAEVYRYLGKRHAEFRDGRSPEAFFSAINRSNTMELHRVPLILAISVGLYVSLDVYEIPRSVVRFYDAMIDDLLRRQDFRGDRSGPTNAFNADDKWLFLRNFALAMAQRPDRFEDFSFEEIVDHARLMTRRMTHVDERHADTFVREIIDRAGLLKPASVEDEYVFAHRSIQEYLVAAELARDPSASATALLERATDPQWQYVIELFATLDHAHVDRFITELAERNLPLAGRCLAGAPASDEVATHVMDLIAGQLSRSEAIPSHLPALVAGVRAPRPTVGAHAVRLLSYALLDERISAELHTLAQDPEVLLRLLTAVGEVATVEVAGIVADLAALVPVSEPRVVAPIWRTLAAPNVTTVGLSAAATLCRRLLDEATEQAGLDELQRQPGYAIDAPASVVDRDHARGIAYPFVAGQPRDSNLVTLLVLADTLGVGPTSPNRFFLAKMDGALGTVERSRQRSISVRPHGAMRFLFWLTAAACVGVSAYLLVEHWHRILEPYGWWSIALWAGPPVVTLFLVGAIAELDLPDSLVICDSTEPSSSANPIPRILDDATDFLTAGGEFYWDADLVRAIPFMIAVTLPYSLALLPLAAWSPLLYPVAAIAATYVLFYLPATRWTETNRHLYLRRPNHYVTMYDDPRSRHWVTP